MKKGRNELCPCGSGKKFKKCCLTSDFTDKNELFWRSIREVQTGMTSKSFEYFFEALGTEEIEDAWDEFNNFEVEEKFSPEHTLSQLFFTWLFQSWEQIEDEPTIFEDMLADLTDKLSDLDVLYLSSCIKNKFQYYEVISSVPGKTINVKSLLTSNELNVMEKTGSRSVRTGDLVFAKIINIQDINVFESLAPVIIQPKFKLEIVKHHQQLDKKENIELQHIDLFLSIYDRLMNPVSPTITNTDGHLLIPHKLIFDIDSPAKIFEAIHHLFFEETREDILKSGTFDSRQNLIAISFPWLGKGNKRNKQWKNTLYGNINIDGKTMTVEVNSKERAETFLNILTDLNTKGWRLKSTLIESIEQQLVTEPKVQNDLSENPEVLELLEKNMQDHWENWIDFKLPALGNKKPKDAIKTKKGKELVDALICNFERSAIDKPMPGQTLETFKRLRSRLGL
jgi:hypothetical protein